MTAIRIVIFEDEQPARERLEQAVARAEPSARIEIALASVAQAVEWLRAHPAPDLILADIQLSDGLSLEIFDQVALGCPVVFCTAYDEYLVEAMARSGIDYLLKPIKDADVARALAKYQQLEAHFAGRVRELGAAIARQPRRRLIVRRRDGFAAVSLDDVAYFVVDDKLVDMVTSDGRRFGVDRPLGELESELDPAEFFRVNRQYLVRVGAVAGFRPFVKGRLLVDLSPPAATEVVVSQDNAARFRTWLDG